MDEVFHNQHASGLREGDQILVPILNGFRVATVDSVSGIQTQAPLVYIKTPGGLSLTVPVAYQIGNMPGFAMKKIGREF